MGFEAADVLFVCALGRLTKSPMVEQGSGFVSR